MPLTKEQIEQLDNPPPNDFRVLPINQQEIDYLKGVDFWMRVLSGGQKSMEDLDVTVIDLIESPNNADRGAAPPDHGRYFVILNPENGKSKYSNWNFFGRPFRVQTMAGRYNKLID